MSRMGYRAAIKWLIDNDDCSWLGDIVDGRPILSVPASLVSDIYGVGDDRVERDLRRAMRKAADNYEPPDPMAHVDFPFAENH